MRYHDSPGRGGESAAFIRKLEGLIESFPHGQCRREASYRSVMEIRIRKLDEDDDAPHVELFISGGGFAARQDSYVGDEEWLEFGAALQSFPKSVEHEVAFENGAPGGEFYCHILLRAFVYDGVGHSALEIRVSNQSRPPYGASAHFYAPCEAATLNRLGRSLELWARSKETEFVFSTGAASQRHAAERGRDA